MIRPVGDAAFLVEVDSVAAAHRVWAALRAVRIDGVREAVVGARSVLVHVDPAGCDEDLLQSTVDGSGPDTAVPAREIGIPVRYDGADLAEIAALAGLRPEEVVERHAGATYTVAFLGFSPGFAYLTGLDPALVLPRRATPRTQVPAGSVAIAGEHTAVYPQPTPGGWHLLGRTDLTVFDPDRARPALLTPGDTVRFAPL